MCPEKRNEAVRGVEHKCDGERLGELGFLSVEKRRHREDLLPLSSYVTRGCVEVGVVLFSRGTSARIRRNGLRLHEGRLRLDEEELLPVSGQPLERAAQGGDRVTVPAGVQGTLDVVVRDVA